MEEIINALMARVQSLESALEKVSQDSLYTKSRPFPIKKQATTLMGLSRALCVDTFDPWKEHRVRFYHPMLHDPKTPILGLPFAAPVSNMGGFDDCGMTWVPPAGSTLVIFFEAGARDAPFYIGTTWHRDRGPGGSQFPVPIPEWEKVYKGHRKGYFSGPGSDPNDEHQVLPPWNTENYNASDIDAIGQFVNDPEEQIRATYPNIYGWKTPEKHMQKWVDGNAKCNRRWKRMEWLSSCGNWMIFKDDHMHYGGQWSHPDCPPHPGGESVAVCSEHSGDQPYFTDFHGKPIEGESKCGSDCSSTKGVSCGRTIGGHPSTPDNPPYTGTKYSDSQTGANPHFKHKNECRPYRGVGTPQNNKCDLPQSGVQLLSISGHTIVMDDSVEEPRGKPEWERSLEPFDYGCNDKYLGVFYIKSSTGHRFVMSDVEEKSKLRGEENKIEMVTACGNSIELNDHTIGEGDGRGCPPNYAGKKRGIWFRSSSNHQFIMCDHMNQQCAPNRMEGGIPVAKATEAYMKMETGYGIGIEFNDANSQEETQQQWIQITHPQCAKQSQDAKCNEERGPHILRFQGRPKGEPGVIFLRSGGHSIRQTYDMDIVVVGDKEKNPSDKFTYVSKKYITVAEDLHFHYTGQMHVLFAEKQILLMAGRDCAPASGKKCKAPCLFPVVVGRCPVICPLTGIVHWTEQALSERVFASAHNSCQNGGCKDAQGSVIEDCSGYNSSMAGAQGPPCAEDPEEEDSDE